LTWLENLDEECVYSLTLLHSSSSLIQEQEVSRCFKKVCSKAELSLQQTSNSPKGYVLINVKVEDANKYISSEIWRIYYELKYLNFSPR
jgi:hypothetical protein